MKLTFHRYDLQLAHNWMVASSQKSGGKLVYPSMLLELRDEDGTVGYGEAAPSLRYDETVQTCVEFIRQIDPSRLAFDDVDAGMRYVEGLTAGNHSAKGAVNIALLDGASKNAQQPLHQLLSRFYGGEACQLFHDRSRYAGDDRGENQGGGGISDTQTEGGICE